MKRRTAIAAVGATAGLGAIGSVLYTGAPAVIAPAEPVRIKFSHVVAENTPKGKAANYFKDIVARRTAGRVVVEVYPNSELYKDKEELEALQLGSIEMVAPSLAKLGPLGIKEFELFDLPFLFDSYAAVHRVTDGPIGSDLLARLTGAGLLGLAFWDNGFKQMSANRPLVNPEDFRGLRMRIQASEVLDAQMRALGALPDAMALSDVYPALQSGVADGTENPPSNFYTQKIYEVQRYLTLSNHGYLGYVVIVSERFWHALPHRLRDILTEAMADASRYANEIAKSENDVALEKIRATGTTHLIDLNAAQTGAWRGALASVRDDFQARVGGHWLAAVDKVNARG